MHTSITQHGSALVVSLIFLVIMTIIGVTAMQSTTLEEKMAGNMVDNSMALQAAEAALRDGENVIRTLAGRPITVDSCGSPPCFWALGKAGDLQSKNQSWWTTNGREYGTAGTQDFTGLVEDPRFVIEEQDFVRDELGAGRGTVTGRVYYRITARARGQTDASEVVLQTVYSKRFN